MAQRRGTRIWSFVSAAALVLSLAACSGGAGQAATDSSDTAQQPRVQQEPPQAYTIDECLVGVWTTVSQREQATVNGEQVVLIDVERQLSFASDGVEVVTYVDTPAAVQNAAGEVLGEVTHDGELTYQVSTDEPGTISFELTGGELSATFHIRGQSSTLTGAGGSGPVTYTCSDAELTQNAAGYEAVLTRAT
ncbi:MAG: hypothetical protein ACR2I7_04640 [Geodermatophilaceae bacterium]